MTESKNNDNLPAKDVVATHTHDNSPKSESLSREDKKGLGEVVVTSGEDVKISSPINSENNNKKQEILSAKTKKRGGWFYRLIKGLIYFIILLVFGILAFIGFILSTEKGLQFTIYNVNKHLGKYVQIGYAEGIISQSFKVENLTISLPKQEKPLFFESIKLEWDLWAILDKKLWIKSLETHNVDLSFFPTGIKEIVEKPADTKNRYYPFSFKAISIPFVERIEIDAIAIKNFKINVDQVINIDIGYVNSHAITYDTINITIEGLETETMVNLQDKLVIPVIANLQGRANLQTDEVDLILEAISQKAILNDKQSTTELLSQIIDINYIDYFDSHIDPQAIRYDKIDNTIEALEMKTFVNLQNTLVTPLVTNLHSRKNLQIGEVSPIVEGISQKTILKENQFNVEFMSHITGVLNQLNLKLSGRIEWLERLSDPIFINLDGDVKDQVALTGNVKINQLTIENADNQLALQGEWTLADRFSLLANLNINAPKLSQIHPDVKGKIVGDISIKGNVLEQPLIKADFLAEKVDLSTIKINRLAIDAKHDETKMIEAHLIADKIKVANISIESVNLDALGDIKDSLDGKLTVGGIQKFTVDENGIQNKGELLKNALLTWKGSLLGHHINLTANSSFGNLEFGGIGQLENILTLPKWTFYIDKTDVKSDLMGHYQLKKPTYIFTEGATVILTTFCLDNLPFAFCLEGKALPGNIVGTATLRNLSALLLKDYIPKELEIDTSLNAVISGQFKDEKDFVGVANISLTKGKVSYQLRGRKLDIPLQTTDVIVQANPEAIIGKLNIDWGNYFRAEGSAKINDVFGKSTIEGDLTAFVPNFDWVAPLFPYLKDIRGNIGAKGSLSGSLNKPTLHAELGIKKGNVRIEGLNSALTNIDIQGVVRNRSKIIDIVGSLNAGAGSLNVKGNLNLETLKSRVEINGKDLQLANSDTIKAILNPVIIFESSPTVNRLTGTLVIPEFVYLHKNMDGRRGSVKSVSPDVVIVSNKEAKKESSFMNRLEMDFGVLLGETVSVGMNGFLGSLRGGLKLEKEIKQPIKAIGAIDIGKGEFNIYGQKLNLDKGRVNFSGNVISNPSLDFQATRSFDNDASGRKTKVGVKVTGSVRRPKVTLFSRPKMPDISIASYLFLGRAPSSGSQSENLMLLNMVRKIAMGENPVAGEKLADQMGLTDLGLTQDRYGNAAVGLGKQINKNLYVGLGVGLFEEGAFATLRYQFLKYFNFDGQVSSEDTSIDIIYSKELK